MVAVAGPQADCTAFIEYIQKNIALTEFKTNLKLSTAAATSFIRKELAKALRKNPYQVNMLIGGWDKETSEGSLYFMDYLASAAKTDYGAQGYAGYFLLSTMDRYYKKDMSVDEAISLAKVCIAELRTRFLLNQQNFRMKIADKDGVREIEL
jgi:20S proteasome subunit beta 4